MLLRKCLAVLPTVLALSQSYADTHKADERFFYVGTELGISEPVIKSFKHKSSSTVISLKGSQMQGARVGYSFYPGMLIELSATYQPKYGVGFKIPEQTINLGGFNVLMPETKSSTKITGQVYTANLIYELNEFSTLKVRPYFIFGAGVTIFNIKPKTIAAKLAPPLPDSVELIRIRKTRQNCLTWQAGAGLTKEILGNLDIDFGAKFQVVNNVKISYQTFDPKTQKFNDKPAIKKAAIAVGEFTVGLTYKFK